MNPGKILCILSHHFQKIISRSGHEVALEDVRYALNFTLKGIQHFIRLAAKCDFYEDDCGPTQLTRIKKRDIVTYDPRILQPLNPAMTG